MSPRDKVPDPPKDLEVPQRCSFRLNSQQFRALSLNSVCFYPGQLPLQPPACSTPRAPPAVGSWHPITTSLELTRVCSPSVFCTVWPPLPGPCLGLGAFSLAMLGLEAHNKCFWINNNIYHSNKEKEMLFAFYVTQKHCPQNFFLVQPTRRVVLKRKVDPAQVSHFTEDTVAQRKQKPLII